ncbi:MAG: protein tyrosine phosphatase [Bacillales bacterium]|jgi:predicted protein tyrosine phosphatase|nr:protein tyrosine phosphatase [Bacillales bacterium]
MEKKHVNRVKEKFGNEISSKTLINLDIPDDYGYMDDDLIEILKARVADHIEVP